MIFFANGTEWSRTAAGSDVEDKAFDTFADASGVEEPQPAPSITPPGLTGSEAKLYQRLRQADRGRLEQEFLPVCVVHRAIGDWVDRSAE